ncbi:hypothetical protein EII20_10345 [Comamonadaceae bacterium OH2545_COT-014]|nr:hypothetical protein EII20_10345 [Comamonadaceae bacterium OH2545_COT-014]
MTTTKPPLRGSMLWGSPATFVPFGNWYGRGAVMEWLCTRTANVGSCLASLRKCTDADAGGTKAFEPPKIIIKTDLKMDAKRFGQFTQKQWLGITQRMFPRASLDDGEQKLAMDFLMKNAKQ